MSHSDSASLNSWALFPREFWTKYINSGNSEGYDRIVLKSIHGKFVSGENGGNLIANRDRNGEWEKFEVIP